MASSSSTVQTVIDQAIGNIASGGSGSTPTWTSRVVSFVIGGLFVLVVGYSVRYVMRKRAEAAIKES
jgi:hypothetical protein